MLTTKVAADKADSSIAAFVKRRCVEESDETIPGFRHGQLLQSTDDPGELGVIKEGALADLPLVNGNPLQNLDLVADPDKNFVLIMKEGKIYKNLLK